MQTLLNIITDLIFAGGLFFAVICLLLGWKIYTCDNATYEKNREAALLCKKHNRGLWLYGIGDIFFWIYFICLLLIYVPSRNRWLELKYLQLVRTYRWYRIFTPKEQEVFDRFVENGTVILKPIGSLAVDKRTNRWIVPTKARLSESAVDEILYHNE